VYSVKDLSIIFSGNLFFSFDIVINMAPKILGILLKNIRKFKNVHALKMFYCSLVRSNLEFGSFIWGQNSTDNLIDSIQYKFLESIPFRLNVSLSRNSMSLVENSIISLSYRKLSDVLYIYLFMIFLITILNILIY